MEPAHTIRGVVETVDAERGVCSVSCENGLAPADITWATDRAPLEQDLVWVMMPGNGASPFIYAYVKSPRHGSPRPEFRTGQVRLQPGDHVLGGEPGGTHVILRSSGELEIGSGPLNQTVYVPVRNLLRHVFENLHLESPGLTAQVQTRRKDRTHGDAIPCEARFSIREFADEPPVIDLHLGRIKEEDMDALPGSARGQIVASLNVNDRFRLWIDKTGAVAYTSFGACFFAHEAPVTLYYAKNLRKRVVGAEISSLGAVETDVERGRSVRIGHDDSLEVGGAVRRLVRGGGQYAFDGDLTHAVGGQRQSAVDADDNLTVGGNQNEAVGGTKSMGIGEDLQEFVGGQWRAVVGNGMDIRVANGECLWHASQGPLTVSVGPSAQAPMASLEMKVDGTLTLSNPTVSVEITTRGVRIKTPGESLVIDSSGRVGLGSNVRGGVVTTLTHPVDFMTGTPILGSLFVGAAGPSSPTPIPPAM